MTYILGRGTTQYMYRSIIFYQSQGPKKWEKGELQRPRNNEESRSHLPHSPVAVSTLTWCLIEAAIRNKHRFSLVQILGILVKRTKNPTQKKKGISTLTGDKVGIHGFYHHDSPASLAFENKNSEHLLWTQEF